MRPPPPAPRHPSGGMAWTKEEKKETYPPAGFSLQEFVHRTNYSCKEIPVGKFLQALAAAAWWRRGCPALEADPAGWLVVSKRRQKTAGF